MQTPSPEQQQRIQDLRERLNGNDTAANLPPGIPANLEEELLRLVFTYDHVPTTERCEP